MRELIGHEGASRESELKIDIKSRTIVRNGTRRLACYWCRRGLDWILESAESDTTEPKASTAHGCQNTATFRDQLQIGLFAGE